VLVSDLADAGGNTGYVTASVPKGTMNASLAAGRSVTAVSSG